MQRLTGRAGICRREAILAEFRATQADADLNRGWRKLAREWLALAQSYELAEQISEFLAWHAECTPFTPAPNLASCDCHATKPVAQIEELSTWRKKLRAEDHPAGDQDAHPDAHPKIPSTTNRSK